MNEFFGDLIPIIIFSQKKGFPSKWVIQSCLTLHLENLKT